MTKLNRSFVKTQFGMLKVLENEKAIVGISFEDEQPESERIGPLAQKVVHCVNDMSWDEAKLPIEIKEGTEMQKRVWKALTKIPMGTTFTYKELAVRLGRPNSARAVGSACGKNPIPILVPCHRVVAANGAMGGYSCKFGVSMKKKLLDAEKEVVERDGKKENETNTTANEDNTEILEDGKKNKKSGPEQVSGNQKRTVKKSANSASKGN